MTTRKVELPSTRGEKTMGGQVLERGQALSWASVQFDMRDTHPRGGAE